MKLFVNERVAWGSSTNCVTHLRKHGSASICRAWLLSEHNSTTVALVEL